MIQTLYVEHREHVSDRPFETVVADFESATGSVEEGIAAVDAGARNAEEFEKIFKAREGASGFMRFLKIDHGGWLKHYNRPSKAILYILGNPLIAITMLKQDLGAGLNVPIRLFIQEDRDAKTRIAYDLPSTLMSGLGDAALAEAARQLDAKLIALAEQIAGAHA